MLVRVVAPKTEVIQVTYPKGLTSKLFVNRGETGATGPAGPQGSQGSQGATGVGYSGVTSSTSITISTGLKTFSLTGANQGAFVTGQRVRAIHSDTPTYFVEGTANYIGSGTLIITADKFAGSGSHNSWTFAVAGEVGQTGATGSTGATGATGPTGVVAATAPITYNSGTQTVGITQSGLTLTQSQVTNLTTDLAAKANLAGGNALTGAQTITGTSAASQVLILKGAASQSADLLQIQDSSANNNLSVSATYGLVGRNAGTVSFALSSANGLGAFYSTAAANVAMTLRGAASQTANLQEWQNSAGTVLAQITSGGNIISSGQIRATETGIFGDVTQITNTRLSVHTRGVANIGLAIRGAASQSANLQEWQNSAGTVLAKVTSGGVFVSTGQVQAGDGVVRLQTENSGGRIQLARLTAAASNPGANAGLIYFRDGTTAGTLKLVVRAGAAGAETTILDNIPQ